MDLEAKDAEILKYLAGDAAKEEKLFENPRFLKTPIVRNAKNATVGYCPDVWKNWE
jgi:arsenate reductase-like glutaredoxin family protein